VIARDIVDHFEKRLEALEGKAMICMSRRICVERTPISGRSMVEGWILGVA
jgi:type I site-specific restriction-modification system R (restriction) subunit